MLSSPGETPAASSSQTSQQPKKRSLHDVEQHDEEIHDAEAQEQEEQAGFLHATSSAHGLRKFIFLWDFCLYY